MTNSWASAFAEFAAGFASQPTDAAKAAFLQPGFAYARLPLPASPKQIREANHLMLQQGYCYLRLFVVKYRRQIAACLGQNPTFTRVEEQLGLHSRFRRGDSFVTAYISGLFQAHIAKSRKENPFVLGNLRRLNEGFPIRIGAESQFPALPAPPTDDVEMLDVAQIPRNIGARELISPLRVPANPIVTAQQKVVQSAWEAIQMARYQSNLPATHLRDLETRFEILTNELNRAYTEITTDTRSGMHYLQHHLHGLATQAGQFFATVHQQIARTKAGEEKIMALEAVGKSHYDNLEILAQIVQAEAVLKSKKDTKIEQWAQQKNQKVSGLLGDSTLTKEQVSQLRQELQWEKAKNQREKDRQTLALAELEEKVNKTLENQKDMKTARQAVATDLREARAESLSTTADIRERLRKLSTQKPQ